METLRACFLGRPTQSTQRIVLITASLLFAYVCANPHSMFVGHLNGRFPAISALVAIGCLQPSSSIASHASSASLQLIRLYAPMLVSVALLSHHAAEAKLQVVNDANFKNTPYYGSPVSLNGENVSFTLDERASQVNVTWKFNSDWQIQLEKCDTPHYASLVISDSCKWHFWWEDYVFLSDWGDESGSVTFPWNYHGLADPPKKRRIDIAKNDTPTMDLCAVTDEGTCKSLGSGLELLPPDFCMLATDPFSVSVTNTAPACPINVTIMNAQLLYDVYEPTTEATSTPPPTMVVQNRTVEVNPPLWTGAGPLPPGYVTPSTPNTPMVQSSTSPSNAGGKILYSELVLIAVVSYGSMTCLLYDI